jgi:tRNA(adenine34) deaminase
MLRGMGIWERLAPPWQACMEEAWKGFRTGSWPIGAVIVDSKGAIISRGHNLVADAAGSHGLSGSLVAHAEVIALGGAKHRFRAGRPWVLYSSLEPCPMCTGAIRMAMVKEVRIAARDPFAGGTALLSKTPFMRGHRVQLAGPHRVLEDLVLALMVVRAHTLTARAHWKSIDIFGRASPMGLRLGKILLRQKTLEKLGEEDAGIARVLDVLADMRKRYVEASRRASQQPLSAPPASRA